PDVEPHVPKAIEDGFGDRLAPGGLLVGQQEKEIDVRAGREQPAPVAAGGDDRHVLGFRRVERGIKMLGGEFVNEPDRLVLHEAEPLGAASPVTVVAQAALGHGAARAERGLEALGDGGAQLPLAPAMQVGEGGEVRLDGGGIEQPGFALLEFGNIVHGYSIAEARGPVTTGCVRGETFALPGRSAGEGFAKTPAGRAITFSLTAAAQVPKSRP